MPKIINKLLLFVFILSLLNPVSVFAIVENTDKQSTQIQHNTATVEKDINPQERKKILAGDRHLNIFFAIGIIINLIMMTSFGFWAVGQFRQHNKNKK
ncbi:MAG: hypothetical protein GY744_12205 [Gammaproteobacteria bacterium]|nr:hypothetical protein [Gammaproteobacteria bacterium]